MFYRTEDGRVMVTSYTAQEDAFAADKPRLWSEKRLTETSIFNNFDVAPDGKRFAVLVAPEGEGARAATSHVTFLLNFFDELRRRVPAR